MPKQLGIAPMADGQYKADETVTISVVFNEIVAKAEGMTISGQKLKIGWRYTGGIASNVLTFTGQLASACKQSALRTSQRTTGSTTA